MAQKRPPEIILKEKKDEIEKLFSKAEPLVRNLTKVDKLKENSTLKRFCVASRLYIYNIDVREGCVRIYNLFRVRPYRKKDKALTDFIKNKLRALKFAGQSQQLDLFSPIAAAM